MLNGLTLDQISVFVAIVDEGSFAAAARRMSRAQSAITYAMQKLEEQSEVVLFDRSNYRPALTDAGHALLPRARRILRDVSDYGVLARGIARGLEAELSLIVDPFVPMGLVVDSLKAFQIAFPLVQARVSIDTIDSALEALSGGRADLALIVEGLPLTERFERNVCGVVDLLPLAAPNHPLARIEGPIEAELLRDHVQLVLSFRSTDREQRDFGVLSVNRWHLTDLDTKHAMLLGGLGWGSMPSHRVVTDLEAGRLVTLNVTRWEGVDQMPRFPFVVARAKDKILGPAGRWLMRHLSQRRRDGSPTIDEPC